MFGLKVDYKQFVPVLLRTLLDQTGADILLVPHVSMEREGLDEFEICKRLSQAFEQSHRDRIHIVADEYDQSEIKGIIGMCDFFVGSRMHSCIAALSQGIPTVGLAYSKKFHGVFKTIAAEQFVVDMRQLGTEEILKVITDSFHNRQLIKEQIRIKIAEAKQHIIYTFSEMFG